jgi:DHA1 family multidrug resistance protein-like MFS transporter
LPDWRNSYGEGGLWLQGGYGYRCHGCEFQQVKLTLHLRQLSAYLSCDDMNQRNYRNVLFISFSQFGIAFSFNFIMVFLPFFVHDISHHSSQETLIWVGFILGAPSFAAALASTFWGSLTSRLSAKTLFLRGLLSHAVIILLLGFISSLPVILVLRIVQGLFGGISTVGLIIVSSSSSREWVSRDIGLFQNAMTLGQLIGPPLGALAAATLGYRGAFTSASAFVFITAVFCFFFVQELPHESRETAASKKKAISRKTFIGWGFCFTATIQLMFLPSVLPNVFQGFHMEESVALKSAGVVVMLYTATAMVGTFLLCRLAARVTSHRLIVTVGILGTVLQFLLSLSSGFTSFVAVRMLQTALIAAVIPLVFSTLASGLDGREIGFLNSSRFAGNALGPMIGTSVLAYSSLNWLYFTIGSMSLIAVAGYALLFAGDRNTSG